VPGTIASFVGRVALRQRGAQRCRRVGPYGGTVAACEDRNRERCTLAATERLAHGRAQQVDPAFVNRGQALSGLERNPIDGEAGQREIAFDLLGYAFAQLNRITIRRTAVPAQ
jgi:hypothetical protein